MTIAYYCILIAALLPYVATAIAKSRFEEIDNSNPREWLSMQKGFRGRANAAQQNGFEGFPFFAVAVILASIHHTPQGRIDLFAILYITARVLYLIFYLADKPSLRTASWFFGLISVLVIFISSGNY